MEKIINDFIKFNEVEAIAIGGSSAAQTSDNISDIDVYVFVNKEISVPLREEIVKKYSSNYEVGGEYFGAGDEFFVDKLNRQLDVMYWNVDWFNSVVQNVWEKHYPSNGYTTCFLYTLKNFQILYDKSGWLKSLQEQLNTPYPPELKQNIIKRNLMLMKDKPFASYYEQIKKALTRNDFVSVNHRISAFLASYFDVIFALNETLHPGEKRLINYAKENCKILPVNFEENINSLLKEPHEDTLKILDNMVNSLYKIL